MPDVVCIGELLIDLCAEQPDVSLSEATSFTRAAGGAPANVAVGVQRLGESSGFVGAVGEDFFGRFLTDTLRSQGVDTTHLAQIGEARTSLAWIGSHSDGRKDIEFYRHPGADMFLSPEHVEENYIVSADTLHFGSISRIDESPRAATDRARQLAAKSGSMITYDPNWRPDLWPDREQARERLLEGFEGSHMVKISDEEWEFLLQTSDFDTGAKRILETGVQLVIRSDGAEGMRYATKHGARFVPAFRVDCVEVTGAGDGAMACLISELLPHWRNTPQLDAIDADELQRIIQRANAVGAIACTRTGAIPSLPTTEQVDAFLKL